MSDKVWYERIYDREGMEDEPRWRKGYRFLGRALSNFAVIEETPTSDTFSHILENLKRVNGPHDSEPEVDQVKKLKWTPFGESHAYMESETPFGKYTVNKFDAYPDAYLTCVGDNLENNGFYPCIEEAVEAAQKHFDKCVKACLQD